MYSTAEDAIRWRSNTAVARYGVYPNVGSPLSRFIMSTSRNHKGCEKNCLGVDRAYPQRMMYASPLIHQRVIRQLIIGSTHWVNSLGQLIIGQRSGKVNRSTMSE